MTAVDGLDTIEASFFNSCPLACEKEKGGSSTNTTPDLRQASKIHEVVETINAVESISGFRP
jgi:hypothetical protein